MNTDAMRTLRTATGLAAALLLAGCSTGGTPQPAPASGGASGAPTSGSTDPSSADASALERLDPCTLITDQEAAAVQLTKTGPEKSVTGTGRVCVWEADANVVGPEKSYSFSIDIQSHKGLQDYNTVDQQVAPVTFKNHHGEQFYDGVAACIVTIVITNTSTVNVAISARPATACSLANQYARLIDPKLPAG